MAQPVQATVVQAQVVSNEPQQAQVVQAAPVQSQMQVATPVQAQVVGAQPVQAQVVGAPVMQQMHQPPVPYRKGGPCGNAPTTLVCQYCGATVTTQVSHHSGTLTHLVACGICWLTGCCCCAVIPYAVDGLKDTTHHCPQCKRVVAEIAQM